jgi:hypothetical protein
MKPEAKPRTSPDAGTSERFFEEWWNEWVSDLRVFTVTKQDEAPEKNRSEDQSCEQNRK